MTGTVLLQLLAAQPVSCRATALGGRHRGSTARRCAAQRTLHRRFAAPVPENHIATCEMKISAITDSTDWNCGIHLAVKTGARPQGVVGKGRPGDVTIGWESGPLPPKQPRGTPDKGTRRALARAEPI